MIANSATNPKIGIVEDQVIIIEDLKIILKDFNYDVVFTARSYNEAKQALLKHGVDIVLIDIKLKGIEDGIDLAKFIRDQYKLPYVFVTANADPETIMRAKEVHPSGYLVKPFAGPDVYSTIEIALSNFACNDETHAKSVEQSAFQNSIFVRDRNLMHKVKFDEILYIEADGNHSNLVTENRKFSVRKTLKDIEEMIPQDKFLRIHKSFIVSAAAITAIDTDNVYLGKIELPIGRAYQNVFSGLTRINS